jgi:hypothetical protein
VASVALIFEPLEMLAELFPALAFAEADEDPAAEPLPEAFAPDLLV